MPFKLGAIWAAIKLDTSQFNAAVKQVQAQTGAAGGAATKAGGQFGGMWKKLAMGVGIAGGVTMVTRTIVGQFSDMIEKGREFESAWADVTTMMDGTTEEARDMRDELINLSPTLGSTTDLAKGMYQVLSASIPEDAAILFLESAAEAAVAGVTDTATAVDALTTVINAYGLEAGDVTGISDVMFQTVKSGKLTYEELAGSLGTVIPVAASTGVEFTEISGALAEMTKKGIPASTATMQLRQVLMGILKPSKGAKDAMDAMGLAYGESALKTQGLTGWLEELSIKSEGSADKISLVIENARSLTGVLALAGTGTEKMTDSVAKMESALDGGGQTSEALDKQLQTLDITIETLSTAADKFKISFYNGFVEGIEEAIPNAKDFDDITKSLNETFKLLGGTVGKGVGQFLEMFNAGIVSATGKLDLFKGLWDIAIVGIKTGNWTLAKAAKAWGDLQKEEENAASWTESLTDLMVKGADAMTKMTEEVLAEKDATEDSTEAHKTLIPEIKTTKYEFIDWLKAVGDGKMTIDEYNMRLDGMSDSFIRLAKDLKEADVLDPDDLEPYFTELESLPSATKSVFDSIGLQLFDLNGNIIDDTKELTEVKLPEFWQNFANSVGMISGDLVWDLMDKNSTLEESFSNLFNNIVGMFSSMITDMAQKWATGFVENIISGSAKAGESIVSNIAGAIGGDGAGDIAGGVNSLTGAIGGLANPVNMISNAVGAIASVVTALQGPGGPSSTDSWHFEETWKEQKRLTDYTMINIGSESGWLSRIHKKGGTIVEKIEYTMRQNRKMIGSLKSIAKSTSATVRALRTPKAAQAGAVSFQTELIQTHGTSTHPEYIIPHEDLSRMLSAGGGGGRTSISNFTINISDQIDPYTADRITRRSIIPAILKALETNEYSRGFQYSLGIET